MKRNHFFATRTDVLSVLSLVEKKEPLKYILAFHLLFPEYGPKAPEYNSAADIPWLGFGRQRASDYERYILANRTTAVVPVTKQIGGRLRTGFELGNCPDCIEFSSGGMWEDRVLINGLVQTWSDSRTAQQLMRRFYAAMKKAFRVRINSYWIGPEALVFLKSGGRLARDADADRSLDLKLPSDGGE